MGSQRLSALDASFLEVETPTAHMHVGWVALVRAARGRPRRVRRAARPHRAAGSPRAALPAEARLGAARPARPELDRRRRLRHPRHVRHSTRGRPRRSSSTTCMSTPLERDRPLWEVWIADRLADGRIGVVGKAHHCMVDGIAAVELAALLLDPTPEPPAAPSRTTGSPRPVAGAARPARASGRATASRDRAAAGCSSPLGSLRSPRRVVRTRAQDGQRAARALFHSLSRRAADRALNEPISPLRTSRRVRPAARRPAADQAALRHDGQRRRAGRRRRRRAPLPASAAASSRRGSRRWCPSTCATATATATSATGSRSCSSSCPATSPTRCGACGVHATTASARRRRARGRRRGARRLVATRRTPVQHAVSRRSPARARSTSSSRTSPGRASRCTCCGCQLEEAYPVVPLADRHALSIGLTTIERRRLLRHLRRPRDAARRRRLALDIDLDRRAARVHGGRQASRAAGPLACLGLGQLLGRYRVAHDAVARVEVGDGAAQQRASGSPRRTRRPPRGRSSHRRRRTSRGRGPRGPGSAVGRRRGSPPTAGVGCSRPASSTRPPARAAGRGSGWRGAGRCGTFTSSGLVGGGGPEADRLEGPLDPPRHDRLLLALLGAVGELLAEMVVHRRVGAATSRARRAPPYCARAPSRRNEELGARAQEGKLRRPDTPAETGGEHLSQGAQHGARSVGAARGRGPRARARASRAPRRDALDGPGTACS